MTCLAIILSAVVGITAAISEDPSSPWLYSRCPKECYCVRKFSHRFQSNLRTVDCSNRGLIRFPPQEHLPADVQLLLLNDNRISDLPTTLNIWFPDLLYLNLAYNKIERIDSGEGAFDGLYNLRLLDLQNNRLSALSSFALAGMYNLQELNLGDNQLSAVVDDAFGGLPKLETLHLNGNQLAYIQRTWWQHIPTLYDLSLAGNQLRLVQADVFNSLVHLLRLDLSGNQIFQINVFAFRDLNSLETLQLQNNLLRGVPSDALKPLSNTLKQLNLSKNPIFRISTDSFHDLLALTELSLTGMQRLRLVDEQAFNNLPKLLVLQLNDSPFFAYLHPQALNKVPSLTQLLLHNNNLTVLEEGTLETAPQLRELSFYGNPLACDCNARWLRKRLADTENSQSPSFLEAERIVCMYPAEHKFKLFLSLNKDALPFECPPRIIPLFGQLNERREGDAIAYDCRATGVPRPTVEWVTPAGRHQQRSARPTLLMDNLNQGDTGLYTCIARSTQGASAAQTFLNVTGIQIALALERVDENCATLVWSGQDRSTSVFQILYREVGEEQRHQYAGTVTPGMRSYTLHQLRPHTHYEACIAVENARNVLAHISCIRFYSSYPQTFLLPHLLNNQRSVLTFLTALACVSILLLLCLLTILCRVKPTTPTGPALTLDFDSMEAASLGSQQKALLSASSSSIDSRQSVLVRTRSADNVYSPLV